LPVASGTGPELCSAWLYLALSWFESPRERQLNQRLMCLLRRVVKQNQRSTNDRKALRGRLWTSCEVCAARLSGRHGEEKSTRVSTGSGQGSTFHGSVYAALLSMPTNTVKSSRMAAASSSNRFASSANLVSCCWLGKLIRRSAGIDRKLGGGIRVLIFQVVREIARNAAAAVGEVVAADAAVVDSVAAFQD
jgi:hypothetical protein